MTDKEPQEPKSVYPTIEEIRATFEPKKSTIAKLKEQLTERRRK